MADSTLGKIPQRRTPAPPAGRGQAGLSAISGSVSPIIPDRHSIKAAWSIARRELRSGFRGFRILSLSLLLGVAAISAVGSVSTSIVTGVQNNARELLGGEVTIRHSDNPEPALMEAIAERSTRTTSVTSLRTMAILERTGARRLTEAKGIDRAYPLHGEVDLREGGTDPARLHDALSEQNQVFGVVIARTLAELLDARIGDRMRVGSETYEIRDIIERVPDASPNMFELGPRLMLSQEGLDRSGLEGFGALVRNEIRADLPPGSDLKAFEDEFEDTYTTSQVRVRTMDRASIGLSNFVDRASAFLRLVALSALLVGGIGVANAVTGFLTERIRNIATIKSIGGTTRVIVLAYSFQILVVAGLSTLLGASLGGLTPFITSPLFAAFFPAAPLANFFLAPTLLAIGFGLVVTLAFSILPLARIPYVSPQEMFRKVSSPLPSRSSVFSKGLLVLSAVLLAAMILFSANDIWLSAYFVAGAVGLLVLLRFLAILAVAIARRIPAPRDARARVALNAIKRPGSAAITIIMSLGLGLTILSALSMTERNLVGQLSDRVRQDIPSLFFLGLQGRQVDAFKNIVADDPTATDFRLVPMLSARVRLINGVDAQEWDVVPSERWVIRGDRRVTWSHDPLENDGSYLVDGEWWPQDYDGEQLVSVDADFMDGAGLKIGDTITVSILGRDIRARIFNSREIDWSTFNINFVFVFSPGEITKAPSSWLSAVRIAPEGEAPLIRRLTDEMPNLSPILVREVLERASSIIGNLALALRLLSSVAIATGILVLVGIASAETRRRTYEGTVLKVIGMSRSRIASAFLLEFGILGLLSAGVALLAGCAASWLFVTEVLSARWNFAWEIALASLVIGLVSAITVGGIAIWVSLSKRSSSLLRNA